MIIRYVFLLLYSFQTLVVALTFSTEPSRQFTFEVTDSDSNLDATDSSPTLTRLVNNGAPTSLYTLRTRPTTVYQPISQSKYQHARLRSIHSSQSEKVEWVQKTAIGPDITDRHTLAQLARMAGNAYALPGQKQWYDMDTSWNNSYPFGWESDVGFRGHVFTSSDSSTVVLSIKGTTLQGPTSKKDRVNDNLLTSCCCARVDISWVFRTVCDCYAKNWRCDNNCLTEALVQDSLFYTVGVKLVNELIVLYPDAHIILTGHSLGAILASLLGATFGFLAVAFEAPGERMAATRLHLPLPFQDHSLVAVTHVYNNADPIPQGACSGPLSWCAQAGYAIETRCHLGKSIVYDTVDKFGWNVDIRKHVIKVMIEKVLGAEGIEWEQGREVPQAVVEEDCVDCHKWEFGDFKNEELQLVN